MPYMELTQAAYALLEWIVDWMLILCAGIFLMIMVWTLVDVVKGVIDTSSDGLSKIFSWKRRG